MNDQIATLLTRYGQLLELAGESGFRVRAFQKAADAIRHHPEPIADLVRVHRLTTLSGVGPAIAAAVEEFVGTGQWTALAELETQVPPTLIDLLAIPGLGAKTASRLFLEHQIVDLPSLEAALVAGKLRGLPGMGAKTEAKLLAGIESVKRRSGRMLLGAALPLARRLISSYKTVVPAAAISLAGSVRRMEETVGDIDVVVSCDDLGLARGAFLDLPDVSAAIESTDLWVRCRLISGAEVDLFLSPPETYGSTLVRATGNAKHLDGLGPIREAAAEADVYDRRGLPEIPADLRQGIDEFELARLGQLDALMQIADVQGEFHCHTTWSDGACSVADMAAAARGRGYRFLGISDHTRGLGVANGLDEIRIREQRGDIQRADGDAGIRVFAGAEVEVDRNAQLDFSNEVLQELDVVIASLHSGLRQPRAALTERLESVLRNPNVDIIAHPSGRLIERREPGDFHWDRVFAVAAATQTALEINADPSRLDLSSDLARAALAAGCLLTINCDAHQPEGFANLEYGIANARRAGATPDRVLNCWPVARIEEWLAGRDSGPPGTS